MKEIKITTEFIKLDQFLKWAAVVGSGSDAKGMILAGSVKINGDIVMQRGKKVFKGDKIIVDDNEEFIII